MPDTLRCAYCGQEPGGDMQGVLASTPPTWGDTFICPACAGVNIFTSNLQLRRANPDELAQLGPITQGVIAAIRANTGQRAPLQ